MTTIPAGYQSLDEFADHLKQVVGETCFGLEVDRESGLCAWQFSHIRVMQERNAGRRTWAFVDMGTYRHSLPWVEGYLSLVTEGVRIFKLMIQDAEENKKQ